MFKAIAQIFQAIFKMASAAERAADTVDVMIGIGHAEAQALSDQMAIEREARIKKLRAETATAIKGIEAA